jgi:hypothetical protein
MKTLVTHIPSTSKRKSFQSGSNERINHFHTLVYQNILPEKAADRSRLHLKRISESFILFDWEFFENELEYE